MNSFTYWGLLAVRYLLGLEYHSVLREVIQAVGAGHYVGEHGGREIETENVNLRPEGLVEEVDDPLNHALVDKDGDQLLFDRELLQRRHAESLRDAPVILLLEYLVMRGK